MYDSITSNLARLVRRRWYVIVAAIVLGALAGLALTSSSSTDVSGRFDVRFAPPFDLVAIADSDRVVEVEPATVAAQSALDFTASDSSDTFSATFVPNLAARSVRVTVTGSDQAATEAEAGALGKSIDALVTDPRLTQVDLAIGAADEQIGLLQVRGAELDTAINTLALDDLSRPTLLAQSVEVGRDITDAEVARLDLVAYRSYIANDLVSSSAVEFSTVSAGVTSVVVGAVVAVILALLVLFCVVLLDRRLRRRIHLERFAPGAEIIAVTPSAVRMRDAERAALTTAVASFIERHGVSRLIVAGLSSGADEMRGFVDESAGTDVVFATEQASLVGEIDAENAAYLLVAQWGRSTDFQLSSAVAALTSVSSAPVGVVMIDVPRHDLDWAGVTAGTDNPGDA